MGLCPLEKCEWYGKDKRDYMTGEITRRKCYYEPQCWRGDIDALFDTVVLAFRLRFTK